jgi:hypothetical protein
MRFRRWVSWLAVAAVLLHAATIARHSVIQFNAAAAELASLAGFEPEVICHLGAELDAQAPALPGKGDERPAKPCPVCLGLASAHALPASSAAPLPLPRVASETVRVTQVLSLEQAGRLSFPPNRGPPSLA